MDVIRICDLHFELSIGALPIDLYLYSYSYSYSGDTQTRWLALRIESAGAWSISLANHEIFVKHDLLERSCLAYSHSIAMIYSSNIKILMSGPGKGV